MKKDKPIRYGGNLSGQTLYGRGTRPKLKGADKSEKERDAFRNWYQLSGARRRNAERKLLLSGVETVTCLECNMKFRTLNSHLQRIHNLTWKQYLEKNNVPMGTRCCTTELQKMYKNNYVKNPAIREAFSSYCNSAAQIEQLQRICRIPKFTRPRSEKQISQGHILARDYREVVAKIQKEKCIKSGRTVARICQQCGKSYIHKKSAKTKFCSSGCYHLWKKGKPTNTAGLIEHGKKVHDAFIAQNTRTCQLCGKEYVPKNKNINLKYCSMSCYRVINSQRMIARNKGLSVFP